MKRKLLIALSIIAIAMAAPGCKSQKTEFVKKKWKIKKGKPPSQRYYNKWSLFNPNR
ncbi:MAG: hypothetical protein HRT74_06680 [Flavobacteriales bacterium]|nr:hypothetical protein [Flavobacteriales bacterium]